MSILHGWIAGSVDHVVGCYSTVTLCKLFGLDRKTEQEKDPAEKVIERSDSRGRRGGGEGGGWERRQLEDERVLRKRLLWRQSYGSFTNDQAQSLGRWGDVDGRIGCSANWPVHQHRPSAGRHELAKCAQSQALWNTLYLLPSSSFDVKSRAVSNRGGCDCSQIRIS